MNENSTARIRLDYENAKRQAESLEQLAKRLTELKDHRFMDTLQVLSENWQGDNADAFMNKGKQLIDKMKESASSLQHIAENLRMAADNTYRAETENIQTGTTRVYH